MKRAPRKYQATNWTAYIAALNARSSLLIWLDRAMSGHVYSLLELAGLDWSDRSYSTVSRRQKTLQVAIEYAPITTALRLLVDTTGLHQSAQ